MKRRAAPGATRGAAPGMTTLSTYRFSGVRFLVLGTPAKESPSWAEALTPAEHAVLALLARGMSNAEMAAERGTGVPTVAKQVAALKRKTGCPDRQALAALARQVYGAERSAKRRRPRG
jgi:DNA-binding CsgD family transcriptional regulator